MAKKKKKSELKLRAIKSTDAAWERLTRKAQRYADGNVSAWLRYTGAVYTPRKGEKINLKAS